MPGQDPAGLTRGTIQMAYCTYGDLLDTMSEVSIAQLTDDTGVNQIDMEKVNKALGDAGELVDSYLKGRYNLPLIQVPTMVCRLAATIARYFLYSRRPEQEVPKTVEKTYEDAVKSLELVRDGKINIGIKEASGAQPEPGKYKVSKANEDRLFPRDVLDRY